MFKEIRDERAFNGILNQIIENIQNGSLKAGATLPAERTMAETMGGIAGGGEKQDKENGVLIIRNSFPQLVDVDNLQAVHFGNIDQWLEVRE